MFSLDNAQWMVVIYAISILIAIVVTRWRGYGRTMGTLLGAALGLLLGPLAVVGIFLLPAPRRSRPPTGSRPK
ncbi:MAG: FUSC family protein [Chloroflexi bacterium]|nr:FUSC family protein [Chloroflexota bacterium]